MNPLKKSLLAGLLVASTLGGGALGAAFVSGTAGAQTNPTTTTTATSSSGSTDAPDTDIDTEPDRADHADRGPHEANGITETELTGSDLTKATAAAEAAVPGATVERAETDAEGAKFEVHMTKADGSDLTVKLDADFKVTGTLDGHG